MKRRIENETKLYENQQKCTYQLCKKASYYSGLLHTVYGWNKPSNNGFLNILLERTKCYYSITNF